jgi:chitodextrinase
LPDTTKPTVAITSPSNNSTVSGTINVSANASDNVGVAGVQFRLNDSNLGTEDTFSPYSRSWNTTLVPNGTYTITAIARDAAGNTQVSSPITVTVNNTTSDVTAPTIPQNLSSSNITTNSVTLSWNASIDPQGAQGEEVSGLAGYKIYRNSVLLAQTAGTFYINNDLSENTTYTYTILAYDNTGNNSAHSSPLEIKTLSSAPPPDEEEPSDPSSGGGPDIPQTPADTQNPTVTIISPANNSIISGQITVEAQASDDTGVVGVQFKLNGTNLGSEITSAPYALKWQTRSAQNNTYTLEAIARDADGNTSSHHIIITLQNNVHSSGKKFQTGNVVVTNTHTSVFSEPESEEIITAASSLVQASAAIGAQPAGVYGVIISGPVITYSGVFWQVNFEKDPDGWVKEDSIELATIVPEDPVPSTPTTPDIPTTPTDPSSPSTPQEDSPRDPQTGRPIAKRMPITRLIKYPSNPTVYLLDSATNTIRPIPNYEIYRTRFAHIPIVTVPPSLSYNQSSPVSFDSGALVKSRNNPTIYLILDNLTKYAFKNEQEFRDFGYRFDLVIETDPSEVNRFPDAPIQRLRYHAANNFVRYNNDPTIYKIINNVKYPIPSLEVLFSHTTLDQILTIPDSLQYQTGSILGFADGTIVKGSSPTVYIIDNNLKRPFTSLEALLDRGLTLDLIRRVPDPDLNLHPDGEAVE